MSNPRQDDSRNAATFLAMFGLLAVSGGLLFLTAMVLPQIFFLVLVVFGFVLLTGLQYLVWGRWLSGKISRDEDDSE